MKVVAESIVLAAVCLLALFVSITTARYFK